MKTQATPIDLGVTCRDIVTGFKGIAIARIEHLFNGSEIKIQPQELKDDGAPRDPQWFEESRVEQC